MNKVKIPKEYKDLRRVAAKGNAKKGVIAFLWYGFWAGTLIYYELSGNLPHNWVRLGIFCALIIVLGIFFSHLPVLFKPGFEGKIERIKYKGLYATSGEARKKSFRAYSHMVLIVRLFDGRKKRVRFPLKKGFKSYYMEGDPIIKYNGLTYPYSRNGVLRGDFVCINCGGLDKTLRPDCLSCGCPVMQPKKENELEWYEPKY